MTFRFIRTSSLVVAFLSMVMISGVRAQDEATADEAAAEDDHGPWIVSFADAKETAGGSGRAILMEFTGSDWCPPCIALHDTVLVTDVFNEQIPEDFVLLKLDNPRDKSHQSEEEQAQYQALQ